MKKGILAAVPLAFIFPSLTYIQLNPSAKLCWSNLPALSIAIFGITVTILGLFNTPFKLQKGISCSHGQEMPYCSDKLNSTSMLSR
jgi:amino acid transporter, putative (fragment)